jgi:hypothetical protein
LTPTREAILEKALEIYVQDCYRNGTPELAIITPEISELKESGTWSQAISELMMDKAKHETEQWSNYDRETQKLDETENNVKTEIPFSVSDALASGFYICGTRQLSGKTNLAKILVSKLIGYGVNVYVIDPSLAWLSNSPIRNVIQIPKGCGYFTMEMKSTVFDVSRLGYAERFAFVRNFCKIITDGHLNGYSAPEMVVFEECHTYLPNGCMKSRKYSDIVDFCTVGGNYLLSFAAITQFSASVDKAIVKLAQQRFFGLTTELNDKNYVRSFIGKRWMDDLIRLQRGQFLYQNRATIQKFQCEKYGAVKGFGNCDGYSYEMQFPLVM